MKFSLEKNIFSNKKKAIDKKEAPKKKEDYFNDYFPESYKEEVLPIIEIIKPDGISLEEYQEQVSRDLFNSVEKRQLSRGQLINDPEDIVKEAKEILMARLKSVTEDSRDYNSKKKPDKELVKKAKIALIFDDDDSDASKYFSGGFKEVAKRINVRNLSSLRNYIVDEGKFTESDIDALLKTKLARNITSTQNDSMYYIGNYGTMDTISDALMIALVQAEEENSKRRSHYSVIKNGLEVAESEKYSNESLEQLLASDYTSNCLEYFDKFSGKPIEKILKSGLSEYDDPIEYLKNSNLTKEEFDKYLDIAVKHSIGYKLRSNEGRFYDKNLETVSVYQDVLTELRRIERASAFEGNEDNFLAIKEIVSEGNIGLALAAPVCELYIKKYVETDYEDFKKSISKYDQEHLVFKYLKSEDKVEYAKKLVEQGEEYQIVKLSESFDEHSLGLDIFEKIKEKNLIPCLQGKISIFKDLTEKEAFEFIDRDRASILVDNIDSFNLSKEFLSDKRVQEACLSLFEENISSYHPASARIISDRIPLPPEKLDEIILKVIEDKWKSDNSAAANVIYAFPEIKKYLADPKYIKMATSRFNRSLENKWINDVIEMMECFSLDKELIESEENKIKYLELIKREIPDNENINDFDQSLLYFFKKVERFGNCVKLPEYLQQQKEKVAEINLIEDLDVVGVKRELIINILHSQEPNEKYDNLLQLIKEAQDFKGKGLNTRLLKKYIEKFEFPLESKEKEQLEKQKFFSVVKMAEKYNIFYLLLGNWDLYEKLSNLSEEQIVLFSKASNAVKSGNLFKKDVDVFMIFEMFEAASPEEQEKLQGLVSMNKLYSGPFDESHYSQAVVSYVDCVEELNTLIQYDEIKNKIIEVFSGDYKDVALKMLNKDWAKFLNSESNLLPLNLYVIGRTINNAGGAGNLKHFEALGGLAYQMNSLIENPKTAERTKKEIKKIFADQELRFDKEKMLQDSRSEFYNLSSDIIKAAPSLYAAFAPILESIPEKDLKTFVKEIFPFYQAQLVMLQNMDNEEFSYQAKDLVEFRKELKNFGEMIKNGRGNIDSVFTSEKSRLLNNITNGFKDRFGLIKIPAEFGKDGLRSIQNCIRYIGNINDRNETRETIISFYLGLEINKEWDKFRRGENIKVEDYFSDKKLAIIKPLLEERKKGFKDLSKILNIPENQISQLQKILQDDVLNNMIGNTQTVDVKLENIKNNVLELTDPDIYENQRDKKIIELLSAEGKMVGVVLAKTYRELMGQDILITEPEREIKEKIATIFNIVNWKVDNVKEIQVYIQPFSLISSMINKIEEEKVSENIEDLQKRLNPTNKIIKIFNNLGEAFEQESGAMALSKDITYLENLVVKDNDKLNPEEREEIKKYLDSIKDKMKTLEVILDKIKEYFIKIKKSSHLENNSLLQNRLADIEKIIYSTDSSGMIISHMTKDLNLIIENMRQCLGCMRKEINNDTNLSFGDYNKFFMINQGEKNKGSVSDEIVFFFPAKISGDKEEMTFVLDRVYGSKSSDILISNIMTVYKKYLALKKVNNKANISISITNEAMSSVGLNAEILKNRLTNLMKKETKIELFGGTVDIPTSAFSDNYIEFGSSGARSTGSRDFSGINIK